MPNTRAREGERAAPLPGAGLGREALDALLLVEERLGERGVRLVAAGRAHALVLVVDVGRACRAPSRGGGPGCSGDGPVQLVRLADRVRDLDLALGADLLEDQRHREQRREVVGTDGLARPRVERRRAAASGRSAAMLYQARGIRSSSRRNLVRRGRTVAIAVDLRGAGSGPARAYRVGDARANRSVRLSRPARPRRWSRSAAGRRRGGSGTGTTRSARNRVRQPAAAARSSSAIASDDGDGRAVQPRDREVRPVRAVVARPAQRLERRVQRVGERAQLGRTLLDAQPQRARLAGLGEHPGAGEHDVERPCTVERIARPPAPRRARGPAAVSPRKRTVRCRLSTRTQRGHVARGPRPHASISAWQAAVAPAASGPRRTGGPGAQPPASRRYRSRSAASTSSAKSRRASRRRRPPCSRASCRC